MKKPVAWCLVAAALASGCTIVIPNAQINAPVNANAKTTVGSVAVAPPSQAQEEHPAASPLPTLRPTEPPQPSEPPASPTTGVTESEETLRNTGLASSLVALELMAAIAADAGTYFAAQGSGGAIGGDSGLLIPNDPRGYNLLLVGRQTQSATNETANQTEGAQLVSSRKDPSGQPVVTGRYSFKRTQTPLGGLHYALTSFQGQAKGFQVSVSGELGATPNGLKPSGAFDGTITSQLTGKLALNGRDAFTLNELTFNTSHPLPGSVPEGIGRMKIRSVQSGTSLDLKANLDRGVVQVEGARTTGNGIITMSIEARDNSTPPSGSPAPNFVANPAWN